MQIIPAIDLKGGQVVRLAEGDMDRATIYGDDPAAQADLFAQAGARHLHVVDLDGSFAGEAVNAAARSAWRDGSARIDDLRLTGSETRYRLEIDRSGRGEAYLLWRFAQVREESSYDALSKQLGGVFGDILSRAGIEFALVAPQGIVLTTTPGLAERATGNRENSLAGHEFVQLLRSDDRDRIFFAREGQQGSPQTLAPRRM